MESPSQAPHSGGSPWKGLLLTASILSCWIQPTSAQSASVTVVPKPPYGAVGSSVILDIQGISEQPPSYTWQKRTLDNEIAFYRVADGHLSATDNRLNVFSNGSLLISNLRLSDTDNYTVQFFNSISALIETVQGYLVVYGLLPPPTISSTNMAPVENKDTVSLTCESNSQDVTDLVWFINQSSPVGDRISLSSDNRTLTIISVTREDQGPYECEIWNPVSRSRSQPFTLNITYGPDTPVVVPINPNYPVGATLVLSCSADSNPPAQYTWLFNGVERTSTPQLSIPDVSLNDTGTYICNASNSVSGLSSSKDINVTISEIVSKPNLTASSTNVLENTTLVITCITEHQGINILWVFNNESLSLNERKYLSENNQMLTIRNVRREDAGSYQCEVWNPISNNRSDPLTLTVNYGPDSITFSPTPEGDKIQVTINNPLTLVCQVESYPPAQYEWRVNGTVTCNFSDNSYTINNTSWEDSGSYTCLAWNNMTNLSVSKVVTVSIEKVSPGRGNGSSFSTGDIAGIVIGVLVAVALTGGLIYFFFFKETGRASKYHHSEKNCSAPKYGEDTTLYENTACEKGSAVFAQALDSSPAIPQAQSESPYQALDITQVDVYEKIGPWKNPQGEGREKRP
ncbi:cell adhesion molecule CEACAM6-like isoform X1 [Notamacropus eugenii]|uniref:cell adhesion molecule CEACAM6-like isoform X1 n=1 Tax=Notamacropus eugenii TaxID=9315 RepID=UPI003B66F90F